MKRVYFSMLVRLTWVFIILFAIFHFYNNLQGVLKERTVDSFKFKSWQMEQEKRQIYLLKQCNKIYNTKDQISFVKSALNYKNIIKHLVVDDNHEFVYCYIPKIGCTNWKKIMMILSGKTSVKSPEDPNIEDPHAPGAFYNLHKFKPESILRILKNHKKFLFVRHPFERLISAYRDKFESNKIASVKFKVDYGPKIISRFSLDVPIPFPDFVDYILREAEQGQALLNEHWATYDRLCHPCFVKYDYIGHYETLLEDAENILNIMGAPKDLHFPLQKTSQTSELVEKYMSYLSEDQIEGLYKLYSNDFLFFDYNKIIKPISITKNL